MAALSGATTATGATTAAAPTATPAPSSAPLHAYAGAAGAWAADAALAYRPLAERLVGRCPIPLEGALVVDAGTGTGLARDALVAAGATVVATDLEEDMARFVRARERRVAVADVVALPLRSGAVDAAVAAFVVNHLADPVAGVAELRRVTRAGGAVVVSAFSIERASAKAAVDAVAVRFGFEVPAWYAELQRRAATVGTVDRLSAVLAAAGFAAFDVSDEPADIGLVEPERVVRYRLGLPHLSRFAAALAPGRRDELVAAATDAVRAAGEEFRPHVIEAVALV